MWRGRPWLPRICAALLALANGGDGAMSVAADIADAVNHYVGTSVSSSPDGRIPYNKTDVFLKRATAEGGRLVVETWTRSAPSPSMPPVVSVLRLTRRGESLEYDVVAEKGARSGIVTFASGALDRWTLDLDLGDGRRETGTGRISGAGVRVAKTVEGARPMRVVDEFRAVSGEVYEREIASMRPPKQAE